MFKIHVSEGDQAISIEKSNYRIGYARVSVLE